MSVEFVSISHTSPASEINAGSGRAIDLAYLKRYVRTLDDAGFDYTLLPYGSNSPDSFVLASAVGQLSDQLKPIVALRPNTTFPLVAAQKLSTLDQLTEGRAVVHFISGGNDAEQARQGDYLSKAERYARTEEYIQLLRRAWTETAPFSHEGAYYKFDDFGPGLPTYHGGPLPISIGGSSDEAFDVGGREADIFSFWGEPVADIKAQIERVNAIAAAAGRSNPRIWVTFRPIIAQTDELAWQKAFEYTDRIEQGVGALQKQSKRYFDGSPQNVGSQRLLDFAAKSDVYDRALYTRTASATNAAGASTALVGSPETVAAAILDYIEIGADLISIRGYDTLNDAVDYGRYLIPLVRQELAHREATGQKSSLQDDHPGALAPGFDPALLVGAAR